MPMTPKEIVRLLQENGFVYVSSSGSHRKYRNPATGRIVIVPFHAKDLKPGTEKNILKMAGLK
ncbi:MAG TPA: type II toxin-antitoxin system HicA family toxin [Candidatus Faecalibacterium faecipullorum]|uniref:Type II toxin-antitoxin system HicA family toxin n=1 Tax=Candidatus Faecalibacterium faecipullorum TaxID=2838578 RepID=A0A9D2S707_9FIRM|nr:type II toxin-antitoxin system HicA family toxin [Candidatus Faecalibacterium faecipullorum]